MEETDKDKDHALPESNPKQKSTESKKSETRENENTDAEKTIQHSAAICVGLICIVIGIPLWWKTTEVYRVSLPFSDIQNLAHCKVEYLTEVDVIWAAGKHPIPDFLSVLAVQLNKQFEEKQTPNAALVPKYRVAVREANDNEKLLLKRAKKMQDLRKILPSLHLSKYNMVITKTSLFSGAVISQDNNIFLSYNNADVEDLSLQIIHLVRNVVRDVAVARSFGVAKGMKLQRPDKDMMRSYRYHSGFDIAFTLMVPEPDKVFVNWDIESGVEDYLQPLIASLEEYTLLTVSSQIHYFISLGGNPKKREDGSFCFKEHDLPHVINPLEAKLGSHASNNPGLNFVVYVPTVDKSPLYILDKRDQPISSNAFLSPQWGGVVIYNVDKTTSNSSRVQLDLDMHKIMEVFITQMRLLLNVHAQEMPKEFEVMHEKSSTISQWELAGWLRLRCIENIATASTTLKSLAQLLEEISNIVINDDIGKEVKSAVASIQKSHQLLANGHLQEAFLASRAALQSSEEAFFHPSLLELLYFPEDQKFAIYIPLFLPISIPIITSTLHAIKWFRQQKKSKSD